MCSLLSTSAKTVSSINILLIATQKKINYHENNDSFRSNKKLLKSKGIEAVSRVDGDDVNRNFVRNMSQHKSCKISLTREHGIKIEHHDGMMIYAMRYCAFCMRSDSCFFSGWQFVGNSSSCNCLVWREMIAFFKLSLQTVLQKLWQSNYIFHFLLTSSPLFHMTLINFTFTGNKKVTKLCLRTWR